MRGRAGCAPARRHIGIRTLLMVVVGRAGLCGRNGYQNRRMVRTYVCTSWIGSFRNIIWFVQHICQLLVRRLHRGLFVFLFLCASAATISSRQLCGAQISVSLWYTSGVAEQLIQRPFSDPIICIIQVVALKGTELSACSSMHVSKPTHLVASDANKERRPSCSSDFGY